MAFEQWLGVLNRAEREADIHFSYPKAPNLNYLWETFCESQLGNYYQTADTMNYPWSPGDASKVCRVWVCEASQGVARASAGHEMSYMSPWGSRTRRCRRAKAARGCGDVGRGYTEPEGWAVASDRKRSHMLLRGMKLRICCRLGRECVALESLRPRMSATCSGVQTKGTQSTKGVFYCWKTRYWLGILECPHGVGYQ
ncbi:hypothetical protein EDB83DRAFT_2313278 [Lactarius deliciosus]|nr:hypothetical protein EDB83DRAFT_2313278 [Lactarius deliciosus]